MIKASIVIPAHNEEKRIGKILRSYLSYFSELKNLGALNFEIVVVLNACSDRTEEVVRNFMEESQELRMLNLEEGGKGLAIIEGFRDSVKRDNDFSGFVDADMATPPKYFHDLISVLIKDKEIDGAIANRWDKKSVFNYSKFKKTRSFVYNFIVRGLFLFPYKDTQCGAKVFRKDIIERNIHKLISIGWNFDVALLFCLKKEENAKIVSIPTYWIDDSASKINLVESPAKMLLSAIRLRLIHSPFSFVARFYREILPNWVKFHQR